MLSIQKFFKKQMQIMKTIWNFGLYVLTPQNGETHSN